MRSHHLKIVTIGWIYCVLSMVSIAQAGGDTVARVTDLQGSATEVRNGVERSLRILARVKDGAVIELHKGTLITLHFSAKRRDMRFVGPDTVKVTGQSAKGTNGAASTKDHDDIGISLDLSGSGLGGIIARSLNVPKKKVKLQHPVKSKVIAGRPLSFLWSSGGGAAVYTISLKKSDGRVVLNARTRSVQLALPSDVQLEPGMQYQWTVAADLGNGEATQASSEFEVADATEASRFYTLATAAKDTVSDLVLYALHLDELQLKTESEEVWQRLEILRPGISVSR